MITLKIKTPIWTGDIDSKSDSLQSTGIMGSLRWWTEAILRGMGKFTCDPVDDNSRSLTKHCPIPKENNHDIAQYCHACFIFGATGMRRMFRLHMSGGEKTFDGGTINIKPDKRNRGWYLGSGLIGKMNLEVIPLDKNFEENLVLVPLTVAARWGGLGAKTQHGYGVVELKNNPEIEFRKFNQGFNKIVDWEYLKKLKIEERKGSTNLLPNIKDMFFAKVQFEADNSWWKEVDGIRQALNPIDRRGRLDEEKQIQNTRILTEWFNSDYVPITPAIKNWLRYGKKIKTKNGRDLQVSPFNEISKEISPWLFGSSDENNKTASKINLSCAYRINNSLWEFRIWGWIPESSPSNGFDRKGFLDSLKKSLDGNGSANIPWNNLLGSKTKDHKLKIWREFNSNRDTVKQKENNIDSYLQSLLNGEGVSQ